MKDRSGGQRGLTAQMVLSFTALVLLTAVAVGLPAIMLIRDQVKQQAWAQVALGSQATEALFLVRANSINDLAALTARRPTLKRLVSQNETAALPDYLQALRAETELDLLLVCDTGQQPLVFAEGPVAADFCELAQHTGIYVLPSDTGIQIWLLATESIEDGASTLGQVVVGTAMDDQFLADVRSQTGLEHTLLLDGQPVASSFPGGASFWQAGEHVREEIDVTDINQAAEFALGDQSYYVARIDLETQGIVDEVALGIQDIVATERQVIGLLIGSILLVIIAASLLGVVLAHRVSRPLTELAGSAQVLKTGNLDKPVHVEAQVREVTQLAEAIEEARRDLQRTVAELRQSKGWTDNLLEAINEGIVTLDEHGYITFFSPGAERITGLQGSQAVGQHCNDIFRTVNSGDQFSRNLPPPDRQTKTAVLLADGRAATLAFTGASLARPGSDQTELALVFRDVSEAEMVHRFMGEFLANITHEFRTPISALTASTELLLDQADSLDQDELNSLLTSLYMGIVGLQTLVDNLLESARLEAGRFQVSPHPIELGEIIAEAVRIMRPLVDRHGQGLVVELPARIPMVQADSRRMTQVLVNLLSNANRYSPDDSEIGIRATVDGNWVCVYVADQGSGVAAENIPDLFRPYVIPEKSNGKSRYGAGLGLPVVKAIVEAHGGQVGVQDKPGGGSLFWFTLPKANDS